MYSINGSSHQYPFLVQLGQGLLKEFINRFPNLHKIDNLVVNCKSRTVDYHWNGHLQPVLSTHVNKSESFKLSQWDFEKFNQILKDRENVTSMKKGTDDNILMKIENLNERFGRLEQMMERNLRAMEILLNKSD